MASHMLAGMLLVYSITVLTQSSRLPSVYKRLTMSRYPHRVNYLHKPLRLQENSQYFTYYENYPMRKTIASDDVASKLAPKTDSLKESFGNLFDKNGMILLTLPRTDEDRILNQLMSDVINYKAGMNEKALRQKKSKYNKSKNVIRSKTNIFNLDEGPVPPRNVFNFYDIVG